MRTRVIYPNNWIDVYNRWLEGSLDTYQARILLSINPRIPMTITTFQYLTRSYEKEVNNNVSI